MKSSTPHRFRRIKRRVRQVEGSRSSNNTTGTAFRHLSRQRARASIRSRVSRSRRSPASCSRARSQRLISASCASRTVASSPRAATSRRAAIRASTRDPRAGCPAKFLQRRPPGRPGPARRPTASGGERPQYARHRRAVSGAQVRNHLIGAGRDRAVKPAEPPIAGVGQHPAAAPGDVLSVERLEREREQRQRAWLRGGVFGQFSIEPEAGLRREPRSASPPPAPAYGRSRPIPRATGAPPRAGRAPRSAKAAPDFRGSMPKIGPHGGEHPDGARARQAREQLDEQPPILGADAPR